MELPKYFYFRLHPSEKGTAVEIEDASDVDVVEVIRCKDCKHWICHDRRCGYWNHGVKPLDWCSYAERKTDGRLNKQTGGNRHSTVVL